MYGTVDAIGSTYAVNWSHYEMYPICITNISNVENYINAL